MLVEKNIERVVESKWLNQTLVCCCLHSNKIANLLIYLLFTYIHHYTQANQYSINSILKRSRIIIYTFSYVKKVLVYINFTAL